MTEAIDESGQGLSRGGRLALIVASMAGLFVLLAARMLGPSDLWDQTQTRTVSCTTDMIVHGGTHWVLPIERGVEPSTKPPLYNWLAVPMVKLLGFNSEIAHRFPSIISVCLCWLIVVRLGRAIDPDHGGALGWIAGLALVANASIFKLGYLARPDMLLTLWLLLGWIAATAALTSGQFVNGRSSTALVAGFWLCVALAALTKGPAALVLPLYVLIAARVLCGSWREARVLQWWWGVPLAAGIAGLWVYGVWRINPGHLQDKLWGEEIFGRVTGLGPEGNRNGPIGFFKDMPLQAMYFIVRFLPWSVPALASMWIVIRRTRTGSNLRDAWLLAATVQVLVIVGLFTLSTGKRADYIAGAFAPGAILAGWWLLKCGPRIGVRQPWTLIAAAIITSTAMIEVYQRDFSAPVRGFGDSIRGFIDQASERISREPLPGGVVFCWSGETQLQAMLGRSQADGKEEVFSAIDNGDPFWVVAGRKTSEPYEFAQWLRQRRTVTVEPVLESSKLPRDQGWPQQVTLYRVTPGPD